MFVKADIELLAQAGQQLLLFLQAVGIKGKQAVKTCWHACMRALPFCSELHRNHTSKNGSR